MHELLPGILETDWSEIEKKLEIVKKFTHKVHIDLIDKTFSDKESFLDHTPFKKYTGDLFIELHMMVDDPKSHIERFASVGVKRFIGHIEHMPDQVAFVSHAERFGEVGLALDEQSQVDDITVSLEDLESVLVMMCKAGVSGQDFKSENLDKVRKLRDKSETLAISVDGGITDKTVKETISAGANRFASTSYLFWNNEDPALRFKNLHHIIDSVVMEGQ